MQFQLPPIAVLPSAECSSTLLDDQLRYLKKQGIWKVVLCLEPQQRDWERAFGDGHQYDLKILYGEGLLPVLPLLGENFFLSLGKPQLDLNYYDVFVRFLNHPKALGLASEAEPFASALCVLKAQYLRQWVLEQKEWGVADYLNTLALRRELVFYRKATI